MYILIPMWAQHLRLIYAFKFHRVRDRYDYDIRHDAKSVSVLGVGTYTYFIIVERYILISARVTNVRILNILIYVNMYMFINCIIL